LLALKWRVKDKHVRRDEHVKDAAQDVAEAAAAVFVQLALR